MRQDLLVSIITVCYNRVTTLSRTLESVANQDWCRIEHIVIDGASNDGSLEIINKFRDQLSYVLSEPDNGIYEAMNKGLKHATGDIICFLNADDYYKNSKVISHVVKQFKENKLDALAGDVGYFQPKKPEHMVRRYRSDRFRPSRLEWGWMPAHPALFLKKDVVSRLGYFKTNYQIAGDFEFIIRAFHKQVLRYQHLPEVLVCMQVGGISTSGLRSKVILNYEVLRACRENGLKTNIIKILSKYPIKLLELFIR